MADICSAELEMTVNMLIQIDKLVQLLESPVFTCMKQPYPANNLLTSHRSPTTASGAGKAPSPLQMPLRFTNAPSSVICIRSTKE